MNSMVCPFPINDYPTVTLAHGGGGRLMNQLIQKMMISTFDNQWLNQEHDGAVLQLPSSHLAFSTDSYVVDPLFFPGGNIGSMAVHGTVNDLCMCGAKPLFISVGLILEEGLAMETLWKIIQAMQEAARQSNIHIVTGDTKVVDNGKGDGIFINTSGIGVMEHKQTLSPSQVKTGDAILLSGDIGCHGIAIIALREGLSFESDILSDSAPLVEVTQALMQKSIPIHCMRDLTRGGLASALNEIASKAQVTIHIQESQIPVREDIKGACEILGFDPLYVANEGRFICFVPQEYAPRALQIMQRYTKGLPPQQIGVVQEGEALVTIRSSIGTDRIVSMLSGEQLPRIC